MKAYEIMYIMRPTCDAEVINNKFKKLIEDNEGQVNNTDVWGKKRLAYEVRDEHEGIYTLVSFFATPSCIKELDRVMKISDEILRHMIISKGA